MIFLNFPRYDVYLHPIQRTWSKFNPFRNTVYEESQANKLVYQYECYAKSRECMFLNSDKPELLFPKTVRSKLVWIMLINSKFGECHYDNFETLLRKKFFTAYPVHEPTEDNSTFVANNNIAGDNQLSRDIDSSADYRRRNGKYSSQSVSKENDYSGDNNVSKFTSTEKRLSKKIRLKQTNNKQNNLRQSLSSNWASFRVIFKEQPIHDICEYFGSKIAFYFLWLGFYSSFLVPAAIVGLMVFFYGCASNLWSPPIDEICSGDKTFLMCPMCDKVCSYYYLHNASCTYSKITRCFDNEATPVFAVFMSIWSVFYLSFWRRRESKFAYKWRTFGLHEMVIDRPEFKPEIKGMDETIKCDAPRKRDTLDLLMIT